MTSRRHCSGASSAEDMFASMLARQYGIVEGEHYVREHRFERQFYDETAEPFRIRADFWFPQWRIVVEFKSGPLGQRASNKREAKRLTDKARGQGKDLGQIMRADWSNQLQKFLAVGEQAPEEPETDGILWILVDDGQMDPTDTERRRYSHYGKHQADQMMRQVRRGCGWNPMGQRQCGRLLSMFRQADELTPEKVYDEGWLESLPMMTQIGYRVQVENTRRLLIERLHEFDTHEPVLVEADVNETEHGVGYSGGYVLLGAPQ